MKKAGILGGGQLGRMLLQAAANYPVEVHILENDPGCPAAQFCRHFTRGDIRNFDDVYNFGKSLDLITIEIENVNLEALEKLQKEGVKIFPRPHALRTLKNKILQKQFYAHQQIPSSDFVITDSALSVNKFTDFLPAVHKLATDGYDGKGVQLLHDTKDIKLAFDAPAVLEKMVDIKKEIAILVAVDEKGKTAMYAPVDMVFDNHLNILSYQLAPAELEEKTIWKMEAIALKLVQALDSPGLFAIELFLDKQDAIWVNETAPRVHNSGHHSIEACYSSQFDMLWRIMLGYPLGNTKHILPAAIVNLLGQPGYSGPAAYQGLDEVLAMENVFVHIYGKQETRPGRKMGHITILSNERQELLYRANKIKNSLSVKTHS